MELLIVMVIVTVLVTIAVPKYKGAMERGRGLQAIASVQALSDNLNAIYVMNDNTYGSDSQLTALPGRTKELGGNTKTDLFTYTIEVKTPGTISVTGERKNLGSSGYKIIFLNQNGELTYRCCTGYQPYCKLLGASKAINVQPIGECWSFQ